jgi:fructosamine-3-kinase
MQHLQAILNHCGIRAKHVVPVYGGDINKAYCIEDDNGLYFLKINSAGLHPGMFAEEAAGLEALKAGSTMYIPTVMGHGNVQQQQYLLLEWVQQGSATANFWENFGGALAQMHRQAQPYFGWHCHNYIGSLPQFNTKHNNWQQFYTECRLLPLVQQLHAKGAFNKAIVNEAEKLCSKLSSLFPEEPPALLHGDLWSGNFMATTNGHACLYDPAVYYGHREMDIGMSRLFGGFDRRFYEAYHYHYPLQPGWQQRLPLTQLYPVLVHALLFGGHYVQQAAGIIREF